MTSHDSDSSLSDTLIDMHNLEPSFTSIDKQKSILIKDLNQSNKRHLGQYIICQLINQIHNTHLAQHLIVQDLKGDEILVQCFHLFFDKNKSSFSIG